MAEQCTQQMPFATAQIKHTVGTALEQHLHHCSDSVLLEAERTLQGSLRRGLLRVAQVRVGIVIVRQARQCLAGQASLVFEIACSNGRWASHPAQ